MDKILTSGTCAFIQSSKTALFVKIRMSRSIWPCRRGVDLTLVSVEAEVWWCCIRLLFWGTLNLSTSHVPQARVELNPSPLWQSDSQRSECCRAVVLDYSGVVLSTSCTYMQRALYKWKAVKILILISLSWQSLRKYSLHLPSALLPCPSYTSLLSFGSSSIFCLLLRMWNKMKQQSPYLSQKSWHATGPFTPYTLIFSMYKVRV